MTFAEMVEAARIECGVSGSTITSVQNLSGSLLRLKKWVADAWYELQTSRDDWRFMYGYYEFGMVPLQQKYTPTQADCPNLNIWNLESFWISSPLLGQADEHDIGYMEWEHFREMYIRGNQNPQTPIAFAIHPDNSLHFGPLPDLAYHVKFEAWTQPTKLVADLDTPNMPEKFHNLIVWEAMKKYAGYESANEVMTRAMRESKPLMSRLVNSQLPNITVDGGL